MKFSSCCPFEKISIFRKLQYFQFLRKIIFTERDDFRLVRLMPVHPPARTPASILKLIMELL